MSWRAKLVDAVAIAMLIGLVAAVQLVSGSYHADIAADEDEASHAVSSLMIHDYVTSGMHDNPLHFARNYYVHFPKVAIGRWPPLFHACEALWMLVFGRTRAAMLSLVGLLAVALLVSVYLWVRRESGPLAGFMAALALAAPVFMQAAIGSAAPSVLLALISFRAAVAFGNYLETGRRRDAVWFALWAVAAAGVHGRGVVLAVIPVIAPLLYRRQALRRRLFFAAGLVATAVVLAVLPHRLNQAFAFSMTASTALAGDYFDRLTWLSWPVLLLAVVGSANAIVEVQKRRLAMVATVLACILFHTLIIVNFENRYLVTIAPAVAALFGVGFQTVIERLRERSWQRTALAGLLVTLVLGVLAAKDLPMWRKPDPGYHRLPDPGPGVYLISGGSVHEGAIVADLALREHPLDHIVLRGTKALSQSDLLGHRYSMLFSDPAAVCSLLDQDHVAAVWIEVADTRPHTTLLAAALDSAKGTWRDEGWPLPGVRLFRRITPLPSGPFRIRVPVGQFYFELEP